MNESGKVKLSHTRRAAFVYIRQSSPSQVEYNRESTARQYALVERACELGWAKEQVIVIDEDPRPFRLRIGEALRIRPHDRGSGSGPRGASCSDSKSPAWRATTPTGIDCSICAA